MRLRDGQRQNNLIARPRLHSNRIHVTFIMLIKHEKLPIERRHVDVTTSQEIFQFKYFLFRDNDHRSRRL